MHIRASKPAELRGTTMSSSRDSQLASSITLSMMQVLIIQLGYKSPKVRAYPICHSLAPSYGPSESCRQSSASCPRHQPTPLQSHCRGALPNRHWSWKYSKLIPDYFQYSLQAGSFYLLTLYHKQHRAQCCILYPGATLPRSSCTSQFAQMTRRYRAAIPWLPSHQSTGRWDLCSGKIGRHWENLLKLYWSECARVSSWPVNYSFF